MFFQLPLRFEPELEIASRGPPGLFPELVCAYLDPGPTHHTTKLLAQFVGQVSQALHGGLILDGLGDPRREFKLVLDLFSFPIHVPRANSR
jgi:hypothetical protein